MVEAWSNKLYFGDNLTILREQIADESVDLIYLDPPFNSNANYNVLFAEKSGAKSSAQIRAFDDTWQWNIESEIVYHDLVQRPDRLSDLMEAFRRFLGKSDMMAYLVMMAPRLAELHRVLSRTGTIFLHCDTTASHYLKLMLDSVFGPKRFLNEITWKRSSAHSDTKQGMRRCGKVRDVILVYTKSDEYTWNPQFTPYTKDYLESEYRHISAEGRRYKETDVTAAKPGGDVEYEWRVKRPCSAGARWTADLMDEYRAPREGWEYAGVRPYQGRFWAYSKENLRQFASTGNLIHRSTGMPRLVQYADQMPGVPLQDLWDDIPPALGREDLGYPTQKPVTLLERIVALASNEGCMVLDPFCGCGTAVHAAERLKRRWIGIDITHLAIMLIRHRLRTAFRSELSAFEIVGVPQDLASARTLAELDRYQFENWALGLVDAARTKGRGPDEGVDGVGKFFDDGSETAKRYVVQVKSGHVTRNQIGDLSNARIREKAEVALFVTLEPPTEPMVKEAAACGIYQPEYFPGMRVPRMQILTIADLLSGKGPELPMVAPSATFKAAAKVQKAGGPTQATIF